MKTIKYNIETKYKINKSIFITNLIKITSSEDAKEKIKTIKDKYKDATHNCYAYIINEERKSSDDNEPGGTAGIPIMETLLNNEMNNILCIVTRYFGGIKLGSGGLIRAYRKATTIGLKNSKIIELIEGYIITVEQNYNDQKKLEKIIKDIKYTKEYLETVKYKIEIEKNKLEILNNNNIKYKIIENIMIEK